MLLLLAALAYADAPACDGGDGLACLQLAKVELAERPADIAGAAPWLEKACAAGVADGCVTLGFYLLNGQGLAKDVSRGAGFFQQACDAGDGLACLNLGIVYFKGAGLARDPVRSAPLFQLACDRGRAPGCHALANQYYSGDGVPQDYARSAMLYGAACEDGEMNACRNLGVQLLLGQGVAKDVAKGAILLERSCTSGDAAGCRNLGNLYSEGVGVPQDAAQALVLWTRGCTLGDADACKRKTPALTVETTLTVAGLEVRQLACKLDQPLLGALAVTAVLAKQKSSLDLCMPGGAAAQVRLEWGEGPSPGVVVVQSTAPEADACMVQALALAQITGKGTCTAVLLIGDAGGAAKAAARLQGPAPEPQ